MFKARQISPNFSKRNVNITENNDSISEKKLVCEIIKPKKKKFVTSETNKPNKVIEDVKYTTNRTEDITDTKATSTYEIDTSTELDNRAILERNLKIGKKILAGELKNKVYRGKGAYKPAITMEESSIAASKYTGLYGPVRGSSTNVRSTLRIDYQPDICKDYKETGYCGFGDTCKFLHDRSDYKSGWQIEKEWNEQQRLKQEKLHSKLERFKRANRGEELDSESYEDSSEPSSPSDVEEELTRENRRLLKHCRRAELPYSCPECKKYWKIESNPVTVSCGHYFCQSCAIKLYQSKCKCSKCGHTLDGIMNEPQKLIDVLNKLK